MKNKKIYAICTMCLSVIILLTLCIMPISALNQSNVNLGIYVNGTDGSFSNVRMLERLNKMQAYVFPGTEYNDGTTIDPFEALEAFMPLNYPQYLVSRNLGNSTTSLDMLINLYQYGGENETGTYMNTWYPLDYYQAEGYKNVFVYGLSNNTTQALGIDRREYFHGSTYSWFSDEESVHGFGIYCPEDAKGTSVVYIEGELDIVYNTGIVANGKELWDVATYPIDTHVMISANQTVYIDYALTDFIPQESAMVGMTKFEGEVMVRYGLNADKPMHYVEEVDNIFSKVVSFSDTNLKGFYEGSDAEGASSLGVASLYCDYLSAVQGVYVPEVGGNLNIIANGSYNVKDYSTVSVNVPQNVGWSGMFDWLFDSMGAFLGFEIAPGWSLGILMTVIVGLAVAIWAIRVFLG